MMTEEEDRRAFLRDLERRYGVSPYKIPPGHKHEFGRTANGRHALVMAYRAKKQFVGPALRDGAITLFQARTIIASLPEQEARLLRRFRATRFLWMQAGCPAAVPPWRILERLRDMP